MNAEVYENHHLRFLDFLIYSNSAFNVCSNKEFGLIISGLNSNYIVSLRKLVSDQLLQKRYSECLLELRDQLKYVSNMTLMMDRCENVLNNSIYVVIAITSSKHWILDILHLTCKPIANALLQYLLLSTNKSFFSWQQFLLLYLIVQLPWSNWKAIWPICIQTWFLCASVFISLIWLQSICQLNTLWSRSSKKIISW